MQCRMPSRLPRAYVPSGEPPPIMWHTYVQRRAAQLHKSQNAFSNNERAALYRTCVIRKSDMRGNGNASDGIVGCAELRDQHVVARLHRCSLRVEARRGSTERLRRRVAKPLNTPCVVTCPLHGVKEQAVLGPAHDDVVGPRPRRRRRASPCHRQGWLRQHDATVAL